MRNFEPAFLREGSVSFGDCVEVNAKVHRKCAYPRQIITRVKRAFHQMVAELFHDLAVGRRGGVEIDLNPQVSFIFHLYTVRVQYTVNRTVVKDLVNKNLFQQLMNPTVWREQQAVEPDPAAAEHWLQLAESIESGAAMIEAHAAWANAAEG